MKWHIKYDIKWHIKYEIKWHIKWHIKSYMNGLTLVVFILCKTIASAIIARKIEVQNFKVRPSSMPCRFTYDIEDNAKGENFILPRDITTERTHVITHVSTPVAYFGIYYLLYCPVQMGWIHLDQEARSMQTLKPYRHRFSPPCQQQ